MEKWKILKAQMSDGNEHHENSAEVFRNVVIPKRARAKVKFESVHIALQKNKKACINFATTQNIVRIAWHTAGMIFAHPLQVVWIVSASFKLASVPGPKAFALRAEHLITTLRLVNGNFAVWAWFSVVFEKGDGSDGVLIANMVSIIAIGLGFPAMRACVIFTGGTFPSGRDEAVAVVMSAAMNEYIGGMICVCGRIIQHQLTFCLHEINFEGIEGLDLSANVFDLIVNVVNEFVMSYGGLSGRKHGLFLSEKKVLLMFSEIAGEESLCESKKWNLRMSEESVAENALGNRDIIATEESLVARSAGGLGA